MTEVDGPSRPLSAEWREAERKLWLARVSPEILETAEAGEIDLSTGSPPFPVHRAVKEAVEARVQELEHLGYPPTEGDRELREEIARFDRGHLRAPYGAGEVVITYGAMQALSNVVGAVAGPSGEVLLPAPYWFQFPHLVRLQGAVPRDIPTFPGNHFKLTPKLLHEAITPRSRLLIFTNPNNPTGAVYSRGELADLVEVLRLHPNLTVISDEVYNLLFPGTSGIHAAPSLCSFPEIADRVVVVNSFAKNYAMSGLRVGYAATTDPSRLGLITQRQRFTSLGVNLYLQAGALAGLRATGEIVGGINAALEERRTKAGALRDGPPLPLRPAAGRLLLLGGRERLVRLPLRGWRDRKDHPGRQGPGHLPEAADPRAPARRRGCQWHRLRDAGLLPDHLCRSRGCFFRRDPEDPATPGPAAVRPLDP